MSVSVTLFIHDLDRQRRYCDIFYDSTEQTSVFSSQSFSCFSHLKSLDINESSAAFKVFKAAVGNFYKTNCHNC